MNILFLEGDMSRTGGTERMTAVMSGLLSENHKVDIVSLQMAKNEVFFPLADNVTHTPIQGSGVFRKIRIINKIIRRSSIDVVVNVDTGMGIYGIFASLLTKAKVITWEHANFLNNWGAKLFPYLRKFAAKYSDALVVLTERDKANYQNGIKKCAPITVIPNPIESRVYSYNSNSKTILSVGLFSPIKRFDLIPEIGKVIFERHPDWRWTICGDGPEREHIIEKVNQYNLSENILLPGNVRNIEEYYKSSAIYVMTSSTEGLPMVLLEAKSYGLPLVSFDIMTGPSDIIRDGENGYLIKDTHIDEMTSKILTLIKDDDLRNSFSKNSQLDIEKFSKETVVELWENLIHNL